MNPHCIVFVVSLQPMWSSSEYRSAASFWIALRTRANRHSKTLQPQQSGHELLRQFVIQRFVARLFHQGNSPWVVAGGIGMLIRVPGGRATRDLDLTALQPQSSDRDQVLHDIGAHTGLSDLDPFEYTIEGDEAFTGVVDGTKLRVNAVIGRDRAAVFDLDIAGEELPVSDVEFHAPPPVVPDRGCVARKPRYLYRGLGRQFCRETGH